MDYSEVKEDDEPGNAVGSLIMNGTKPVYEIKIAHIPDLTVTIVYMLYITSDVYHN